MERYRREKWRKKSKVQTQIITQVWKKSEVKLKNQFNFMFSDLNTRFLIIKPII
jgi:hypothetical protein